MKPLEKFTMGKNPDDKKCEDIIVTTPDFYAVIDGVTSKHGILFEGKTGGRRAAEITASAIESFDETIDALNAFNKINEALKNACDKYNVEIKKHLQACAIIYSKYHKEIWNYGDCQLMINGRTFDHTKKIDSILENLRSFVITSYLKEGGNPDALFEKDIGRNAILPFLKKQTDFANDESIFGYPVLNGDVIVEKYILKYKVSAGDRVVLASDGYPRLFSTLEECEKYLEEVLENDPLSINENMQTKMTVKGNLSFDDRSYLSFVVE